jgi:hypothetical protein
MANAYAEGMTLQEIGDEHGLTRERVRQIILGAGYGVARLKSKTRAARRARIVEDMGWAIRMLLAGRNGNHPNRQDPWGSASGRACDRFRRSHIRRSAQTHAARRFTLHLLR